MVKETIINGFIEALRAKFESKSNKKTDISGDFSEDNDSYPTVQATKTYVEGVVDGLDDDLATVAKTGSYTDLVNKPVLDVAKQETAEDGYAATYIIKQDNVQVGSKINIPKDFLVKSASMGTVSTANSPEEGFAVGDKYLDFVINTKDNSGTDEHIYVNVKDLIDTYTADNTSIVLTNNEFSIKDRGVTTVKINDKAVTAEKIADNTITANQIASSLSDAWLSTSDVDSEIESYLSAITTALNS